MARGDRKVKIYTKTGDDGTTGTYGGGRVPKSDARIEALGHIDELNAVLGVVRSLAVGTELDQKFERIQHELFDLGAEAGCPIESRQSCPRITPALIERLEREMDEAELPPLREFILPGGTTLAAYVHLARTVARRAERSLVSAAETIEMRAEPTQYLNRLSDWLFVMARLANHNAGTDDVKWKPTE